MPFVSSFAPNISTCAPKILKMHLNFKNYLQKCTWKIVNFEPRVMFLSLGILLAISDFTK